MIQLHNSLTGKKETLTPIDPTHVRLYACGPTVYNYAHIGNARMAVVFDQLVRVLRHDYPKVTYVSNITDVDDKIMDAARERGEAVEVITRRYEDAYNADMGALSVAKPDIQPRATDHIDEMIALNAQLIERKYAYEAQGHVLFHVPSFKAYGRLSGRSRDDQIAGARVEISPFKKDPADFVLWKPSTPDQMGWDSPWGRGRPGWHIECSAMAEKHLGLPFDIHGGGADLKFPHHENEIAQSCCAHGRTHDLGYFAKMWVHNGFVTVEGEKMSKSIGNTVIAHDLLQQGVQGEAIRLTLLSAHYRQPLDWTAARLQQSKKNLDDLYATLADAPPEAGEIYEPFINALRDDLNTPKAMAVLFSLAGKVRKGFAEASTLRACVNLLGICQQPLDVWFPPSARLDEATVNAKLAEREIARKAKDFATSDAIRDALLEAGVVVEDTPDGQRVRSVHR